MVNRCVCYNTSFDNILLSLESGKSLEDILSDTGVGSGCGLCMPYIHLSIETGKTDHKPSDIKPSNDRKIN